MARKLETYPGLPQRPKMETFATIVNGFSRQPLLQFSQSYMFAGVLGTSLGDVDENSSCKNFSLFPAARL